MSFMPKLHTQNIQTFFPRRKVLAGNATLVLERDLLALDPSNDDSSRVLGDHLVIVQHFELLAGVLAHVREERLRATGVLVGPVRHV